MNYEEMSDDEINHEVAKHSFDADWLERHYGKEGMVPDYCNNWEDAGPVIKDNKIAVAAAYLPLSESNLIPKALGTRHRAAVGISEVTDALTIVVSEETGGVTITKNSELLRDLTQNDYLKLLRNELIPKQEVKNDNILTKFVDGFAKSFKGGRKH